MLVFKVVTMNDGTYFRLLDQGIGWEKYMGQGLFNKNGNLINSTLTIFNGAYAAFFTGNNPPPPYFLGIPSGARGLRLLFAHESGHGIISRTLDQKFRSLSNTRKQGLADDWALKIWEQ